MIRILVVAGALGIVFMSACAAAPANTPNIIVILTDDLGYGDLGVHGSTDIPTPNIDALANAGVRFSNAYAAHVNCSPSRAGLLTGRYQQRFGYEANPEYDPSNARLGIPETEVLISNMMKSRNYATVAIGKWHLGAASNFHPNVRGFDEFWGFLHGFFEYFGNPLVDDVMQHNNTPIPRQELYYLTDYFSDVAVDHIHRYSSEKRPFFMYLAYNAVHLPFQASQKYLNQVSEFPADRQVHMAMVLALDEGIGKVLQALRDTGIEKDTLVIFINDNGGHSETSNRPLRSSKGAPYEGGLRVPFFMSWPGQIPAGEVYEQPVISYDIFPTVMAAAENPMEFELDGKNLLPFLTGEKSGKPHDTLFWRDEGFSLFMMRHHDYKLVGTFGRVELYDLGNDPTESNNLANDNPELVTELMAIYQCWNQDNIAPLWQEGDGTVRIVDEDPDDDGILNPGDNCPQTPNVFQDDEDGDGRGDACDAFPLNPHETADSDGDGMGDRFEDRFGLHSCLAADADYDSDEDGFTNLEEFEARRNPILDEG